MTNQVNADQHERELFEALNRSLDYTRCKDAWGREIYIHSHIQVAFGSFKDGRASVAAPVQQNVIEGTTQTKVNKMLKNEGVYISGVNAHPDMTVPLIVIGGKVFRLVIATELNPEHFPPSLTLHGPYRADTSPVQQSAPKELTDEAIIKLAETYSTIGIGKYYEKFYCAFASQVDMLLFARAVIKESQNAN